MPPALLFFKKIHAEICHYQLAHNDDDDDDKSETTTSYLCLCQGKPRGSSVLMNYWKSTSSKFCVSQFHQKPGFAESLTQSPGNTSFISDHFTSSVSAHGWYH